MDKKITKYIISIILIIILTIVIFFLFKQINQRSKYIIVNITDNAQNCTMKHGKIAPGTSGSFYICVSANRKMNYKIDVVEESLKPLKLYFMVEDNVKKYYDIYTLFEENFCGEINSSSKIIKKIKWYWEYDLYEENANITEYHFTIRAICNGD